MNGFELNQQRGIDGIGYVRALRSILTSNLPALQPILQSQIVAGFTEELTKHGIVNGMVFLQLKRLGMLSGLANYARLESGAHVSNG